MGLLAEPLERVGAPEEDVVRVDAVEVRGGGTAGQDRLREELHSLETVAQRRPVLHGDVEGLVDEEPGDAEPAQVLDVRLDALDRPARVRLEVDRDGQARCLRRPDHERETNVLR